MTTWWINFEDQATEKWLGVVVVDSDCARLDGDGAMDFISRLAADGLTPPADGLWWVKFQRLPPDVSIPDTIKNRLITDARETAPYGGVMMSRHGVN